MTTSVAHDKPEHEEQPIAKKPRVEEAASVEAAAKSEHKSESTEASADESSAEKKESEASAATGSDSVEQAPKGESATTEQPAPSADEAPAAGMQHVETEDFFKSQVAKDALTVASFSAPWCGSCKQIKPQVEKLADELAGKATFLKLDAEELEDLFEELEVESFPHFRVYKNDELLGEYTGNKMDKIEEFVRANVQ